MRTRPPFLVLALLAFALRALIPIGFMPAADGTLSLIICPGGFPPQLLAHEKTMPEGAGRHMPGGHQGHGIMEGGFCLFTTGFSSAPPPLILAALFRIVAIIAAIVTSISAPTGIRRVRIPQARAPPAPI